MRSAGIIVGFNTRRDESNLLIVISSFTVRPSTTARPHIVIELSCLGAGYSPSQDEVVVSPTNISIFHILFLH